MRSSLLITNARIWRGGRGLHASGPHWLLVRDGRIASLGAGEPPREAAEAVRLDADGKVLLPGLIDAHMHLVQAGQMLRQLDLSHVSSRDAFENAVAEAHAQLPPGEWLIAHGWSSENWAGELPDKSWLDEAGERPVVCYRMDLHAALANDAVLKLCDLRTEPAGGRILRDVQTGDPTGMLIETAAWELINPIVPRPSIEQQHEHLLAAQDHAHKHGITTVGSMEYARTVRDVLLPMRDRLTLRTRITMLDRDWPLDCSFAEQFRKEQLANEVLDVIGFKAFVDGTLGSRTARMLDDYADEPGNRGLLVELAEQGHLGVWAKRVVEGGWSPAMHAIGDEAVRLALDAIESLDREVPLRIEHAQTIQPDDVPRFAGIFASMQPLHKADDGRYAASRLGEDRLREFFPYRQLRNAGATLAFGSDWPVVSCDPMLGARAAVTGLTTDGKPIRTEENLTVEEALRAYTVDAAAALGLDDVGEIAQGKRADLVLLDCDPFEADWVRKPPRVMMTMAGGKVVYDGRRT